MNAVSFFPSRTVTLYMARKFVLGTLAILAMLVLVLQTLDLLGESEKILAYAGNGEPELWRYVGLRTPQIIARFLPFSVLLATILTLSTMNQNSEIIALKASGLSAHQVLAPLIVASLGIAIVSFVFNERIVTRASATLDAWESVGFGPMPADAGDRSNVWVKADDDLIQVQRVDGRGVAAVLTGLTIYQRRDGVLQALLKADRAVQADGGWRAAGVSRFDIASGSLARVPDTVIARGVEPDRFTLANVDADEMSYRPLDSAITELEAAGRPVQALEAAKWHKVSGPLAAVLMPLLGAVAAFGVARSGKLFVRAVIGMGLGFAYFVADNFALAMGNLGAYPPFLAAWAPFLLFLLIGEAVLVRTEE